MQRYDWAAGANIDIVATAVEVVMLQKHKYVIVVKDKRKTTSYELFPKY